MSSFSGRKLSFGRIIRFALFPLLWVPLVGHADSSSVGDDVKLLRMESALVQHWIEPANTFEGNVRFKSRSRPVITAPEPYSFLLATFGVFGAIAMGTLFRKRKKTEQEIANRLRVNFGYTKKSKHHISVVGRNR